jgi:hypothetical protein
MRRAVEVPMIAIIERTTNSCIIATYFWQNEAKMLNLFKETASNARVD